MKKIIDKQSGRIISILNVDEAKKVLKMYINYCLDKQEVKKSRLNLVGYLGDFINYSEKKDIAKFYDILVKEKDGFEFSKTDAKAYDSLISFFELYSNIENGTFELNNVSSYITSAVEKRANIESKLKNGEELNFEEKLNNIFFNKGFDLNLLAKRACQKYEESLKEKIEQNSEGVDVSLQEELAYQDLVDLCSLSEEDINKNTEVIQEPEEKVEEEEKEETVEIKEQPVEDEAKEETEQEVETEETTDAQDNQENEQELVIEDDEKEDNSDTQNVEQEVGAEETASQEANSEEQDNNDNQDVNNNDSSENETVIQPDEVQQATGDISLRDAADFFNGALDGFADTKKEDSNDDSSDSFGGTLRDR